MSHIYRSDYNIRSSEYQDDSSVGESIAEKVKQGAQRVTLVNERIAQKMKLIVQ
jgi:hypothetical protein